MSLHRSSCGGTNIFEKHHHDLLYEAREARMNEVMMDENFEIKELIFPWS